MTKKIVNMQGHKHGIGGYNFGCRCEICKEAKAIKRKEYQSSAAWRYQKTYRQRLKENNPQKLREIMDKENNARKAKFAENPELYRWQGIYKKYKLTKQMYLDLLEQQNGVCAICSLPPKRNWLAVDHDHSCCPSIKTCGNCIRGLLCGSCNSFLGRVNDDANSLIAYLEKYAKEGDA